MASAKHAKKRFLRRPPVPILVALVTLVVLLGGSAAAAYGYDQASNDRILPGVRIAGVSVGGMTRSQAVAAVRGRVRAAMHRHLTIHAGGKSWTVTFGKLGMRADARQAVDEAFGVSGSVSFVSRVYHRLTHHPVHRRIELKFTYDEPTANVFAGQVVGPALFRPARNAAIKLVGDSVAFRHSHVGRDLKTVVSTRMILAAMRVRRPEVTLPLEEVAPKVSDDDLGKTLTVDLTTNTLHLYEGFSSVRTYPVATARAGFITPVGTWEVVNKVENPTWINPAPTGWGAGEPLMIPPGPGNPLGTRALYLNASGIRIHGTPSDSSIGTYASHGCIRMHIPDSEALYPLVPVGTKVIIFGAPPWGLASSGGIPGT